MSTLAYASLTTKREQATPGTSTEQSPPGVGNYIDALAALVPAEVLTLHAVILSFSTKTQQDNAGNTVTIITEPTALFWTFWGLLALSILLYVVPRGMLLDKWDFCRVAIPPIAFCAWTMLQKATAFDAVCPHLREAPRTIIALFVAAIVALVAAKLAGVADKKTPPAGKQ